MRARSHPGRWRGPDRIQIGTDPTDGHMAGPQAGRAPRPRPRPGPGEPLNPARPPRPGVRPPAPRPVGGTKGRDMPTAIGVGVAIAVVFLLAVRTKPWVVAMIVVLVLALAAVEYFDRVREKGYEPAIVPGLAACIAAPLAVYFYPYPGLGAAAGGRARLRCLARSPSSAPVASSRTRCRTWRSRCSVCSR